MQKISAFMMIVAAGFAAMPTQAQDPQGPANRVVTVRVNNPTTPPQILIPAKDIASKVLAQAGIRLVWRTTYKTEPTTPMGSCGERRLQVIDISVVDKAPQNLMQSAMASAYPFSSGGVRIVVYWDRVQRLHEGVDSSTLRVVLGHVLAHEIGHILIGKNEHSLSGLMKTTFSRMDQGLMRIKPLPIDPADIEIMQRNLDNPPTSCSTVVVGR